MDIESIVFGGGCFWCTEAVFKMFRGVISTMPGYAGGTKANPTYGEVCTGTTGHAEVLKIEYDPLTVNIDTLLDIFFNMHDPTQINRQGNDVGGQYRSVIFYTTKQQKDAINKFIDGIRGSFDKPIATQVAKLATFYPAEEHHRLYYDRNRLQPYCMMVVGPKVSKMKKKYVTLLK